jgi:general secretion pathway protein G
MPGVVTIGLDNPWDPQEVSAVTLRKVRTHVARGAFTLMEMLVVVAIIVMLAGLGAWGYMKYLDNAKVQKAKMDCVHISEAVEGYYVQNGTYPSSLQELTQSGNGQKAYLDPKEIIDPAGQQYRYDPNMQSATGKPKISTVILGQEVSNW